MDGAIVYLIRATPVNHELRKSRDFLRLGKKTL